MAITCYCPKGHKLSVSEKHVGKQARCKVCQAKFLVPEPNNGKGNPLPGYRPVKQITAKVYLLAAGLLLVTSLSVAPVFLYCDLLAAPGWARAMLLLAGLQLIFVAWMVLMPDWSTVWVVMVVFASVAATYGFTLAVTIVAPPDKEMMFDLHLVRSAATWWCCLVIVLTTLMTYLCGRTSYGWRSAYLLAHGEHD